MNKIQIKMNFKPRLIKDIKLTLFKNGRNAREIKREWRPIFVHQMAEFEEAFFGISTRYNQGKESMDIIISKLYKIQKNIEQFIDNARRSPKKKIPRYVRYFSILSLHRGHQFNFFY